MDNALAIAHYVRFLGKGGSYKGANYQNFFIGEARTYGGIKYFFAPFMVAGTASTRGGDVGQSALIMPPSDLSVGMAADAITNRWLVEVSTVRITATEGQTITEDTTYSTEIWSCTAGSSRPHESIRIELSSPLDAARATIPGRVLSRYMVGAVPPTGQISTA